MAKSIAELAASASAAHSPSAGKSSGPEPVETPPEKAEPKSCRKVSALLADIEHTIKRFVVLPSEAALHVLALFVVHTYAFDASETTPYLAVTSPEKQSGKTRVLEVLSALCRKSEQAVGPSASALFHLIAEGHTILWDEVDTVWAGNGDAVEAARGILNSGFRRGGTALRMGGSNFSEVKRFDVYGPKVLCGIDNGKWPDTVRDRCVGIVMTRKTQSEPTERLRTRRLYEELEPLREELSAWPENRIGVLSVIEHLQSAEPHLPEQLSDRSQEAVEPLIAIADLAGGEWPQLARSAVVELCSAAVDSSASKGTLILGKMREVFGDRRAVPTQEILDALNADDDLPFGGYTNGLGINARNLSSQLRRYGVKSRSVRTESGTPKGFHRDDLEDVWARYLPTPEKAQQAQQAQQATNPQQQSPLPERDVADVADVADIHPQGQLSVQSATFDREATADEEAEAERLLTLLEGGGE